MSGTTTTRTNRVPPDRFRLTTIGVGAGAAGCGGGGAAGWDPGAGAGVLVGVNCTVWPVAAGEGASSRVGSRAAVDLLGFTSRKPPDAIRS